MNTHPTKEWFDDDSFWIDQYSVMFSDQRFAEAGDQAEELIKLVNPQGCEVLDLGCGPGRFAIPLAQKGFHVTGVDRTAILLCGSLDGGEYGFNAPRLIAVALRPTC